MPSPARTHTLRAIDSQARSPLHNHVLSGNHEVSPEIGRQTRLPNTERGQIVMQIVGTSVVLGYSADNTDRAVSTVRDSYEFNNDVKVPCEDLVTAYDYYYEDNRRNYPTDTAKQDRTEQKPHAC